MGNISVIVLGARPSVRTWGPILTFKVGLLVSCFCTKQNRPLKWRPFYYTLTPTPKHTLIFLLGQKKSLHKAGSYNFTLSLTFTLRPKADQPLADTPLFVDPLGLEPRTTGPKPAVLPITPWVNPWIFASRPDSYRDLGLQRLKTGWQIYIISFE